MSSRSVAKDPHFPLRHTLITELKSNPKRVLDEVQQADLMVTRNGETLCYMVSPAHYEALVAASQWASQQHTEAFLAARSQRPGGLAALDASYAAAQAGQFVADDEVAEAFGA